MATTLRWHHANHTAETTYRGYSIACFWANHTANRYQWTIHHGIESITRGQSPSMDEAKSEAIAAVDALLASAQE